MFGQPQVSSASVNLATETAVVWAVPEVKATENWKQSLGEKLANHLTGCGFKSSLRVIIEEALRDTSFPYLSFVKRRELKETFSLRNARATKSVEKCISDSSQYVHYDPLHLYLLIGLPTFADRARENIYKVYERKMDEKLKQLKESGFHLSLSLFTLIGPGRRLIVDGVKSLFNGSPNMNTLVGLGALSSFTVSSVAALIPRLWSRNYQARFSGYGLRYYKQIGSTLATRFWPCKGHVSHDRVPADGIVKAGRSAVDESSFTGEPLPVTKLPGAEVTAGSINLNGTLTVEVKRPGGETVMSDIVRLVEEAQSREAPIQRLADKGSPISLALQLSCSVLVVACPCALGLATPTAVLVGTSLGATRGLLLRGGNVLEKFAGVDTIVFDKTGTLTIGKPIVTRVMPLGSEESEKLSENSNCKWTEYEVLRLAAGVESNTIHPVGKAIVEAASAAGCQHVKAADGTFIEEPGSGALATVDCKKVTVGTLEWLQRHGVIKNPFPEADEFRNQSVVYVGVDGDLAGLIYLEDKIRDDAGQVVQSLSKQGLDVYMLSGDKRHAAEYVASVVGIPKERVRRAPSELVYFI
ncbi:hypothetical protein QJS10_CPB19g01412 [Acorus calamus]|uniref:P-type ATPase A domain-containing protein n=1 Tax=Acorus calamus TaxID=4465 RepID=A0AAV9CHH0_ACOCL|nr:hypothetical protein QJS10_CPB19g01412 [Acorus calamus]